MPFKTGSSLGTMLAAVMLAATGTASHAAGPTKPGCGRAGQPPCVDASGKKIQGSDPIQPPDKNKIKIKDVKPVQPAQPAQPVQPAKPVTP